MKRNESDICEVVNCEEASIVDAPKNDSPVVAQVRVGKKLKILSKPNRYYFEVKLTEKVKGFIKKEFVKVK